MSRTSSPLPSSDDSAVGSITSSLANSEKAPALTRPAQQNHACCNGINSTTTTTATAAAANDNIRQTLRPKITRPSAKDLRVDSDDLEQAAKQMRSNNVSLISRSIRTVLSCFDDLDLQKFESRTDYLINFISNGINKNFSSILRPVSVLWPDNYELMVEKLALLDAYLLNTNFREKPVEWMLQNNLASVPTCRQCKNNMILHCEKNIVRWQCQRSQACSSYFMPVQRPSFFNKYEYIGLDKLLFSIYYWSTCTPSEEIYKQMNIEPKILDSIWRKIQNVCRTALEKSYPRHRLTNIVDQNNPNDENRAEPIDLVSIKLNDVFIICAKHPKSNLVRMGLYIPNISLYTFTELTESWFAHGASIRVSETKFMGLTKVRPDLKVQVVPRLQMIAKDGRFYRESAFGYLICQLSHVFKDFDSSTLSRENLKLILSEIQWREIYGTTPYDAFTCITNHIALYGKASEWYTEPTAPTTTEPEKSETPEIPNSDYIFAERYFYATLDPVDNEGKVICRYTESPNVEVPPPADVRVTCHYCNLMFECFDFGMHIIAEVEKNRKEYEKKEYLIRNQIECKHCFKPFKRNTIGMHSALFRSHMHLVQFGCRICCVKLDNRAQYLQHMRRLHFEHETPYRCPKCPFASSFQRDVFIHFQEEHRHSMVLLCTLCLRSFTVAKPELMSKEKMRELSVAYYNHIAEHYVISKGFSCPNCCLCFLTKDKLKHHLRKAHDPMEIRRTKGVKLTPFVVTSEEEKYCVKALPVELFIANKRPNLALDQTREPKESKQPKRRSKIGKGGISASEVGANTMVASSSSAEDDSSDSSSEEEEDGVKVDGLPSDDEATSVGKKINELGKSSVIGAAGDQIINLTGIGSDSDEDAGGDDNTIHVRGIKKANTFLQGGAPNFKVTKARAASTSSGKNDDCSSQKLIDYLSRMKRADGVIPNQSVILTPSGKPAKCCECSQYVTVDHFVASIVCKKCNYITHCPRAATQHNKTLHQTAVNE